MSEALYTVRVWFESAHRGTIKLPGLHRQINYAPAIEGLPRLTGIDYAPETSTYLIQPYQDAQREMTADEMVAVAVWLTKVAAGEA